MTQYLPALVALVFMGTLHLGLWLYKRREIRRGRNAFWLWRSTTDEKKWDLSKGFFPMSLIEGNSKWFQYGVELAVTEELDLVLYDLMKAKNATRPEERN